MPKPKKVLLDDLETGNVFLYRKRKYLIFERNKIIDIETAEIKKPASRYTSHGQDFGLCRWVNVVKLDNLSAEEIFDIGRYHELRIQAKHCREIRERVIFKVDDLQDFISSSLRTTR